MTLFMILLNFQSSKIRENEVEGMSGTGAVKNLSF